MLYFRIPFTVFRRIPRPHELRAVIRVRLSAAVAHHHYFGHVVFLGNDIAE
jgi:hypothetical protein